MLRPSHVRTTNVLQRVAIQHLKYWAEIGRRKEIAATKEGRKKEVAKLNFARRAARCSGLPGPIWSREYIPFELDWGNINTPLQRGRQQKMYIEIYVWIASCDSYSNRVRAESIAHHFWLLCSGFLCRQTAPLQSLGARRSGSRRETLYTNVSVTHCWAFPPSRQRKQASKPPNAATASKGPPLLSSIARTEVEAALNRCRHSSLLLLLVFVSSVAAAADVGARLTLSGQRRSGDGSARKNARGGQKRSGFFFIYTYTHVGDSISCRRLYAIFAAETRPPPPSGNAAPGDCSFRGLVLFAFDYMYSICRHC